MNFLQHLKRILSKPRITAFLLHLGISMTLIAAVFSFVYWVWFPHALSAASGGLEGLTIVAAVDVVLGPILTLVVYDIAKSKAHLTRDIGIIAFLQISCLMGGVFVVHQARPIAIVHAHDTFHVLRKADFEAVKIDPSVLDKFSGDFPKILYVDVERNPVAFMAKSILNELNHTLPTYLRADLYREMPRNKVDVAAILQGKKSDNPPDCTVQNISSVYTSGTVCLHLDNLTFTDFIAGQSISFLDDAQIRYEAGTK